MKRMKLVALFAPMIIATRTTLAQAPVVLQRPEQEFAQSFNYIAGVHELASGALIVADGGEKQLWLVSFASKQRTPVGHQGTGPLDYLDPFKIASTGRRSVMQDYRAQRYLVLNEAGEPTEVLPGNIFGGGLMTGTLFLKGGDNAGHLYAAGPAVVRGRQGPQINDSVPILRASRAPVRVDTVAFLQLPAGDTKASITEGGGTSMQTGLANPFVPRDEWTVAPDGRVALVHAQPYFVEWIAKDGTRTKGPTLPNTPVPVTQADKTEYGKVPHMGASATDAPKATQTEDGGSNDWPASKPAFVHAEVRSDLRGNVWIMKYSPSGDARVHYDVLGGDGQVKQRVTLPESTRIVGFGRTALYAVRKGADGAQFLEEFRLPAGVM
jgi:hypothetical protein